MIACGDRDRGDPNTSLWLEDGLNTQTTGEKRLYRIESGPMTGVGLLSRLLGWKRLRPVDKLAERLTDSSGVRGKAVEAVWADPAQPGSLPTAQPHVETTSESGRIEPFWSI